MIKRKLRNIIILSLVTVIFSSQIVYADDSFEGWTEDNKLDAWDVYCTTEWTEIQDQLMLDQLEGSMEAVNISNGVRQLENQVVKVLKEVDGGTYSAAKYKELVLAMIQVLSDGKPKADDPCNIKEYIDGNVEDMTAEKSIRKLVTRLFAAEKAHQSQPTTASIYKIDNALESVIQGVMYGSNYSRQTDQYTRENSQQWYDEHQSTWKNMNCKPAVAFAEAVASYYKTTSVSGGGITYSGKVTATMQKIADNAKNGISTQPCSAGWCAAWVSGVYQASGLPYVGGNAIDMWNNFKNTGSTDKANIPPGAIVVGSGAGSDGAIYGHVGIYLGNNMVAQNIGRHDVCSLERWISQQTATCQEHHGWIGWVYPYGFEQ